MSHGVAHARLSSAPSPPLREAGTGRGDRTCMRRPYHDPPHQHPYHHHPPPTDLCTGKKVAVHIVSSHGPSLAAWPSPDGAYALLHANAGRPPVTVAGHWRAEDRAYRCSRTSRRRLLRYDRTTHPRSSSSQAVLTGRPRGTAALAREALLYASRDVRASCVSPRIGGALTGRPVMSMRGGAILAVSAVGMSGQHSASTGFSVPTPSQQHRQS